MKSNHQSTRRLIVAAFLVFVVVSSPQAVQTPAPSFKITPAIRAALNRISAGSLRNHLKFIASDELEGRNTPSPGLDRAAEYIAAEFKKAGLTPVGDQGYFQTANWVQPQRDSKSFALSIQAGNQTVVAEPTQVSFTFPGALNLRAVSLVKVDYANTASHADLNASDIEGKAVIAELPDIFRADRSQRGQLMQAQGAFVARLQSLKAAVVVSVSRSGGAGTGFSPGRMVDPDNRPPQSGAGQQTGALPIVQLFGPGFVTVFDSLPIGATSATVSINVDAPSETPVKLRNVVGLLRGSDKVLRDTYVLVTAHYDHLGMNPSLPGPDKIYNGANDDGSGTVSVIEIAAALAKLKPRPKRSIVFMTVFGEERGGLGSRYYGRHPIFPIEKTVADVNLEQVGRTDDSEGPQVGTCAMTGFDFSDVGHIFQAAGDLVGIKVFKHPTKSDSYFGRSDNQALADLGVPAHTLSVAYEYPDYHRVGDHWDKVDYDNMANVDRMVALGLVMIANNPTEPKWDETNPKAARYLKAWRDRRAKPNVVQP
ncbi:MAG TPA: M28 family metallopeptidase [Pyrinomonadaceae bacterium]|nr:M28 family metallopeptidase [Pyrinomonadaceae bacterium]